MTEDQLVKLRVLLAGVPPVLPSSPMTIQELAGWWKMTVEAIPALLDEIEKLRKALVTIANDLDSSPKSRLCTACYYSVGEIYRDTALLALGILK